MNHFIRFKTFFFLNMLASSSLVSAIVLAMVVHVGVDAEISKSWQYLPHILQDWMLVSAKYIALSSSIFNLGFSVF